MANWYMVMPRCLHNDKIRFTMICEYSQFISCSLAILVEYTFYGICLNDSNKKPLLYPCTGIRLLTKEKEMAICMFLGHRKMYDATLYKEVSPARSATLRSGTAA